MKPPSRTIIQVIADPGPGGAPRHVRDLMFGMKQAKPDWRVTLLAPPGWLTNAVASAAEVIPVAFPSAWNRRLLAELADAFERCGADSETPPIIHCHGVRAGIAGRLALARRWPKAYLPVVYTEHLWTSDYHLTSRLRELAQLRLLRLADRVTTKTIAVSQAVANFLLAKRITTQEKLVVIPNGVALPDGGQLAVGSWQLAEDSKTNSELPTPNYHKVSFRLGTVGTLVPLKGHRDLIEAMPLILQNLPQTVLEIIGDGPEMASLSALIRRLGLTSHVRLLGSFEEEALAARQATWDIYVSPSLAESFGLAVAGAMAIGLPVIATRVGGVPELVTAATGRLVAPADPHELAKAIIDLLPQAEERQRLGAAGRERIAAHFTASRMVRETMDLYQGLRAHG